MKVRLLKQAEYDFNESKYTAIPSEVFTTLVGFGMREEELDPQVVMFENKEDYLANVGKHDIDMSKSVYVSSKGQIFCFIKDDAKDVSEDGSADSEEGKGE